MNFTKFNLLLTASLIVILYFMVPFYNEWLWGANAKVLNVNNSMLDQAQNLDTSYRKAYRFGGSYLAYQDMKAKLLKAGGGNVILLVPTTEYLKSLGINDLSMCEPSEFYYFTGLNSVWATSPEVERANWAVIAARGRGISLKRIKTKPELDSLITLYKPFVKY
jgi:hypothetical protein